ncbi:MAG: hypothetical protein J6J17_05225 [Bacilli bacterium]|nr:hypothetical protein [Bacilli bacterium]
MNVNISESIKILNLESSTQERLLSSNINTIEKLWMLNRLNLKMLNFTDSEIKDIIIKLQLIGISLNKKINNNDRIK